MFFKSALTADGDFRSFAGERMEVEAAVPIPEWVDIRRCLTTNYLRCGANSESAREADETAGTAHARLTRARFVLAYAERIASRGYWTLVEAHLSRSLNSTEFELFLKR